MIYLTVTLYFHPRKYNLVYLEILYDKKYLFLAHTLNLKKSFMNWHSMESVDRFREVIMTFD